MGTEIGRMQSAASIPEEKQMSTKSVAVSAWHWATPPAKSPWPWVTPATSVAHQSKPGRQEIWAGGAYLIVWGLLWLAVIVTVLSPLDGLFGGGR
jgi:hypothetical protein